jgi:hypothetical protein
MERRGAGWALEELVSRTETIVAGAVILAGLGLALLAGTASFIRQHVTSDTASGDAAGKEIDREARRFAGQRPVREVRDGQPPIAPSLPECSREPGQNLRALIADVRSRRVVRVHVPPAVLTVVKRGGFRYLGELTPLLEDTEFETDRVDLPLREIDRRGPMLLVDHAHADGARILMWVE